MLGIVVDRIGALLVRSIGRTEPKLSAPLDGVGGDCHRNCQLAILRDPRLTYFEGVAIAKKHTFGHAMVTLDGEHAIDLTRRGQTIDGIGPFDPPEWFLAVPIDRQTLCGILSRVRYHGLFLGNEYIPKSVTVGSPV